MLRLPILVAAALLALPAAAHAAVPGAATVGADSRPTLTWTLGADEQSPAIRISKSPQVGSDGGLETMEEYDYFSEPLTTWTAETPLLAGTYYWQVSALDAEYDRHHSAVQQFVVAPRTTVAPVTFRCVRRKELQLRSGWNTNVETLKFSARITYGRKEVGKLAYTETMYRSRIDQQVREDHDYRPMFASRFRKGQTYRIRVQLTGPGVNLRKTIVARCR